MNHGAMAGKTVMITGATGGIGLASATALARAGATLVLVGRSEARGREAQEQIHRATGNDRIDFLCADFSSLAEVRRVADVFVTGNRPLHVLLNNAGVMNTQRKLSRDGFEEMFAVNYLAHYLLTRMLLPCLERSAPARIVHVASNAHAFCKSINFDDLSHQQRFSAFAVYGHSKLANMLFSNELSRRLHASGVTSNALHPGAVATGIGTNNGIAGRVLPLLLKPFFRSPEKGGETAVYLASSAEVEGVSGQYFYNSAPLEPKPWVLDAAAASRLWTLSERLTGS